MGEEIIISDEWMRGWDFLADCANDAHLSDAENADNRAELSQAWRAAIPWQHAAVQALGAPQSGHAPDDPRLIRDSQIQPVEGK